MWSVVGWNILERMTTFVLPVFHEDSSSEYIHQEVKPKVTYRKVCWHLQEAGACHRPLEEERRLWVYSAAMWHNHKVSQGLVVVQVACLAGWLGGGVCFANDREIYKVKWSSPLTRYLYFAFVHLMGMEHIQAVIPQGSQRKAEVHWRFFTAILPLGYLFAFHHQKITHLCRVQSAWHSSC